MGEIFLASQHVIGTGSWNQASQNARTYYLGYQLGSSYLGPWPHWVWADYLVRIAQGRAGGTKGGSSNQAAARARLLHVHAHTSVLQNMPLYVHCTQKLQVLLFMRWESPVSAGGPQTPQNPGAGGAHMHPARRPFPE